MTSWTARKSAACLVALAQCACSGSDSTESTPPEPVSIPKSPPLCSRPGDEFEMGMGRQGFGRRVSATIEDSVPPPRRADLRWIVRIDDSSGLPITGGDVVVTTWMPDHFHPAAKPAIVTELGEGRYEVDPINLFMPGLWEIVIATTTDSIARDEVLFVFCVD